jgi:magnesium transporter
MTVLDSIATSPPLVAGPGDTVAEVIEKIRAIPRDVTFTYPMVTDAHGRLLGICVMRDLILAAPETRISDVMLKNVVALSQRNTVEEALDHIKGREIPEYPIVDPAGVLRGVVRAARLHELREETLAAVPALMVGLADEERIDTAIPRAIRSRLPWLMINLLTAFAAGAVVAVFQETVNKVVLLATFLPVLAGQSGNTGAQALAIMLRSLSGHLEAGFYPRAVRKELLLGLLHGLVTGFLVAIAIYATAVLQGNRGPLVLAAIGFIATILSMVISGFSGATVPVVLRRLGADPAAASSIIITTITDVVSMGSMLLLATVLIIYLT